MCSSGKEDKKIWALSLCGPHPCSDRTFWPTAATLSFKRAGVGYQGVTLIIGLKCTLWMGESSFHLTAVRRKCVLWDKSSVLNETVRMSFIEAFSGKCWNGMRVNCTFSNPVLKYTPPVGREDAGTPPAAVLWVTPRRRGTLTFLHVHKHSTWK